MHRPEAGPVPGRAVMSSPCHGPASRYPIWPTMRHSNDWCPPAGSVLSQRRVRPVRRVHASNRRHASSCDSTRYAQPHHDRIRYGPILGNRTRRCRRVPIESLPNGISKTFAPAAPSRPWPWVLRIPSHPWRAAHGGVCCAPALPRVGPGSRRDPGHPASRRHARGPLPTRPSLRS